MKHLTKSALCGLYKYSGAMYAQERLAQWRGRHFIAVLLFHRVTDEIPPDGLTVGTEWFGRLCGVLRRRFHVVSLSEVQRILASGKPPPRRTVAITFDDCYRDNLDAARVLADHGLPACFFVPTRFVGTDHVFDWDRSLKRMPNLTWDEVREMAALGHEIGSHTVNHADFGVVGPDEARRELVDSRKELENRLGQRVRFFAYPYGGVKNFRPEYLKLVQEAGYDACFSGFGGFIDSTMFGQVLPREPVPCFRSLVNLELHLAGCLDWFYRLKRKMGLSRPVWENEVPRT